MIWVFKQSSKPGGLETTHSGIGFDKARLKTFWLLSSKKSCLELSIMLRTLLLGPEKSQTRSKPGSKVICADYFSNSMSMTQPVRRVTESIRFGLQHRRNGLATSMSSR